MTLVRFNLSVVADSSTNEYIYMYICMFICLFVGTHI